MQLITGETVTVIRDTGGHDALGEPVDAGEASETVGNVVVAPGATADLDAARPEGVTVAYTLGFPKSYEGELRGCLVDVRGRRYRVIGDPQRLTEANTPGAWDLTAEVGRVDG